MILTGGTLALPLRPVSNSFSVSYPSRPVILLAPLLLFVRPLPSVLPPPRNPHPGPDPNFLLLSNCSSLLCPLLSQGGGPPFLKLAEDKERKENRQIEMSWSAFLARSANAVQNG